MSVTETARIDKWGVISRYATGQKKYDWNQNFRSDGKRFDYDVGANEFVSCELRGYFKSSSDIGDDVSGKLGGGGHHDGSHPKCYVPDIGTDSGENVRLRYEETHPTTPTLQDGPGKGTGNGKGITGHFVGFCYVKRNLSSGVLLEIWQDQGNNEGDTPANQWVLVGSWVDTKYNWRQPPSDHAETLRIDNDSGHNLEWKWITLQEITDGDSSTPGSDAGGDDSGGSSGDDGGSDDGTGGSGSGDDSGGSGDGTGGTGGGVSTPPPPPPPPPEVYQTVELELMWNINYVSGDPCNVNAPPEAVGVQKIIDSAGDDAFIDIPKDMKAGGWYVNKDSVLIGFKIREMHIFMKKVGLPLDGDISINIYNNTNDLVDTFDTTFAVNTLDENNTEFIFTRESPARVLQEGDRISVDWVGGDTIANYIRIQITEQDKADSTGTCLFITDDNQHIEVNEGLDLAGTVYI